MEELKPCPFCGGEAKTSDTATNKENKFEFGWIGCQECRVFINYINNQRGKSEAIAAWNRRAQPENKPLTLDELRQMDGEPVYTVGVGANRTKRYWCLVMLARKSVCAVIGDEMVCVGAFCQYSETWLAYRSKPKEDVCYPRPMVDTRKGFPRRF